MVFRYEIFHIAQFPNTSSCFCIHIMVGEEEHLPHDWLSAIFETLGKFKYLSPVPYIGNISEI